MVAQVGNIALSLRVGKPFLHQAVMKQNTAGVQTNIPQVGKVLTAKFPKRLAPTLVNIPLDNTRRLRGTYKDHLKQATHNNSTYTITVYVITDTDLTPDF